MIEARDYQDQCHSDLRKGFAGGNRTMILQAPTGAGKTVIASKLISGAAEKKSGCLFFAHRRELVYQCSDKLKEFGVEHGLIMSGEFVDTWPGVQVASVDTFRARVMTRGSMDWPDVKVVIIDEAHRSLSPTYIKIIEEYKARGAVILGLTATPIRGDGRGLGHMYEHMVSTPGIPELIALGYLVQPKHYAPSIPDLTGVKTKGGDYNEADLQEAMDQTDLVGDVVANWMRLASDRPTIVFASGVRHSIHLRDEFVRAGVKAAHIDGTTPDHERDGIIRDLRAGKIQVITNCMVLTEGFDCPSLSCCILARPTKNLGLYIQMAGRVLRTSVETAKANALIIDHSGAVYRHGKVDDPMFWSLDVEGTKDSDAKSEQRLREKTTITCEKCSAVYSGQINCPECDHTPETKGKYVKSKTGDLVAIDDAKRPPNPRQWRRYEKVKWFNQFVEYTRQKGYKRGWAHRKYQEKFKEWPPSDFPVLDHVQLEPEFNAYIRHLNMKWAYGKKKQQEAEEAEKQRTDIHG